MPQAPATVLHTHPQYWATESTCSSARPRPMLPSVLVLLTSCCVTCKPVQPMLYRPVSVGFRVFPPQPMAASLPLENNTPITSTYGIRDALQSFGQIPQLNLRSPLSQ